MAKITGLNLEDRAHKELPSGWPDLGKYFGYSILAASTVVGSANCGGSPTTPTPPCGTPGAQQCPPTNNYVTVTNYSMKTRPEGGILNDLIMNLQQNGANVADVDINNNTINITPDKGIIPGIYYANIRSKDGSINYRNTPLIIGNESIKVPVDGPVNAPSRTRDLEILVNGFDFQSYQSGGIRLRDNTSNRWTTCPSTDIYTSLYQHGGNSLVNVDQNSISPERWAQLRQNISKHTAYIKEVLTNVSSLTGNVCQSSIRENPGDPNDINVRGIVVVPLIDNSVNGVNALIWEGDEGWTNPNDGIMTHALLTYDANQDFGKSPWAIDLARAYGFNPPKSGLGSGLILTDFQGNYLPVTFVVGSLLYNRLPNHISNSQNRDLNRIQ